MSQRNLSFDYAKGIGIIIVVFAHLWRGIDGAGLLKDVPQNWFYALSSSSTIWSMPAFFFVSGALYSGTMERRHGLKEVGGKFDGIFYPYIIWSLIIGAFEVIGSGYTNGSTSPYALLSFPWAPRSIFWFLYALFEAFLLTELLIFLTSPRTARLILPAIGVALLLLWKPINLPFALSEFQMSFIYFAIGVFIAPFLRKEQISHAGITAISLAGILATLYIFHITFNERTYSFRSVTPNATPIAITVLIAFFLFCYSLPAKKLGWLSTLGERSMDIYLIHLLLIAPARIALHKVFGITNIYIILLIGIPVGVFGSLLAADLLRKMGLGWVFSPPQKISLKRMLS